jgi:hypothetical protein
MRVPIVRTTLLAALGTLLLASSVLAARPEREPLDAPLDFFLAADSGNCVFDANIHLDVNKEYLTIWDNPDGSRVIEITGAFKVTVTNLTSGASLPVNASGPGRLEFDADGNPTRFLSTGLILGFYQPSLILYAGWLDGLTGAFHGTSTDLCAALS